ncbi:hypothetical protein OPQ81_003081 [Rhizoctonia solani]|nr:hypothetical protein OPQ81_003081 [Rhizoctonia solani]
MPHVSAPTHPTHTFTFNGTDFLYANFPRTPVKELRYLLARGSGYVVRGGKIPELWFNAQCAHYGLPTGDNVAVLRNQLDRFLAGPLPQVPRDLLILEKQKRDEYHAAHLESITSISLEEIPMDELQDENDKKEGPLSSKISDNRSKVSPVEDPMSTQATQPLSDKTNFRSTPVDKPAKKPTLPRAKLAAVAKFKKSVRWDPVLAENSLQEIKLRMGRPEPTSGTDTESEEGEGDSLRSSNFGTFTQSYYRHPVARWPTHNFVPFTADVVSGWWQLRVTYHTMPPLPEPWRMASSKWLKGGMNVQLAGDGRSIIGEFALLGLDGKFKSRKCDLRADGIGAWVRFVAQMPIVTTKPLRGQGHKEHNLTFGPSESQYGYLRFYGGNKVGGMLRCRKYGRLEFTGIRIGGPVGTASDWASSIE